jgi:DNA repair exonuclease SbcCD nuclease subunit
MSRNWNKLNSRFIGCFSDIHLGLGQNSKEWHKIALEFAKWASQEYKEREISEIIIAGDIFHNRSEISVETLSVAKQFFDYFKEFTIYMSSGNHDSFFKENSKVNSISIFDNWDNIKVIDIEPLTLDTNYSKKIGIIPWGTKLDNMPKCDIMFSHLEITSFYMSGYKICEHGFSYKDLFKNSPYIISGHFHKRDHRKFEKGEILYLGSPYQHNFGDTNDDRGIYVFDIKENTFEFIENNISPKHIKYSVKSFLKNSDQLTINSEDIEEMTKNNFISLVVDTKIEHDALVSLQARVASLNPHTLRVDYDEKDSEIQVSDNNKDYNSGNLLKSIEDYIETLDIENKKEVVDYVKELYNSLI